MEKQRVLFVCEHNSARSQMAEAWANHLFGEWLKAESAGLEAGKLNPLVVRVMKEVGIDISHKGTQSAFDLVKAGRLYSYVVTLCDEAAAERCPFFPGITQRLHWSFAAPSQFGGSEEEKLAEIRKIRDAIRQKIEEWAFTIKKP
jgi:arsenate reductase (thioredoxin)